MIEYQIHPAAAIFPMMSDAELTELANDIKENGQIEPVILYEGAVLDGRNRLAACRLVDVEPMVIEHGPLASPVTFVFSRNLHRRHLTVSQRGLILGRMMPLLQEEAKLRQLTGKAPSAPIGAEVAAGGRSRDFAAKIGQVGTRTVDRAVRVLKTGDEELISKVERGELTLNAAYEGLEPATKGYLPEVPGSPRGRQRAEAHKRRMIDGLSTISGICYGLTESLDVSMAAAACDAEEIELWATKADTHARELRKFAAALRGATNESS